MAKRTTQDKELAYMLFQNNVTQKDICERLNLAPLTLNRWIKDGGWKEKRAAATITRTQLVNQTLSKISALLQKSEEEGKEDNGLSDKLIKLAAVVERLDKKGSNVVQDIETFMSFNEWLQKRATEDESISFDLIKTINQLQDTFVNEKMSVR